MEQSSIVVNEEANSGHQADRPDSNSGEMPITATLEESSHVVVTEASNYSGDRPTYSGNQADRPDSNSEDQADRPDSNSGEMPITATLEESSHVVVIEASNSGQQQADQPSYSGDQDDRPDSNTENQADRPDSNSGEMPITATLEESSHVVVIEASNYSGEQQADRPTYSGDQDDRPTCPICLNVLRAFTLRGKKDSQKLNCKHKFCGDCIFEWAMTMMDDNQWPTCPICRKDVWPCIKKMIIIRWALHIILGILIAAFFMVYCL
jgi:hypothetical protein